MRRPRYFALVVLAAWGLATGSGSARGQGPAPLPSAPGSESPTPANLAVDIRDALFSQPSTGPEGSTPIELSVALRLAGATPLEIAAATARLDQALGALLSARALKIPNLNGGLGYYRHDGQNQNLFTGQLFQKGTNALLLGGGTSANFAVADALFAPLAAKRVVGSRRADVQAARNDVLNDVAQAYFTLQEAKGRLVGAEATIVRSERLARFAEGLAPTLIAPLEINRARAQVQSARQFRETTLNDWRVASARLAEILLLEPSMVLDPVEPPFLRVAVVPPGCNADELLRVALSARPEIASRRELLLAAEQNLRREKTRPLLPNVVLTAPGFANAGLISGGEFYGGANNSLNQQGGRLDVSAAAYWQLYNGGFGNLGLIRQRRGERDVSLVEVTRTIYRVKAEVAQSLATVQTSASRVPLAELELKEAIESADKNFVGLRETTRPAGELLNLVVRPQEVVASLQVLNQAFQDYSGAVSSFNRAQFALYRSLGQPAQWITSRQREVGVLGPSTPPGPPAEASNPAPPPPRPPGIGR